MEEKSRERRKEETSEKSHVSILDCRKGGLESLIIYLH